jgi:xylulokinase
VLRDFSVAKEWVEYIDRMEPSQENHDQYMEYFALYKQIYEHVKDDFRALAELRDQS